MKKIISILTLLGILFSILGNNVYAINSQVSNVITKNFLEFQGDKTYKINFKNITSNNYNVIQKKFEGINSFPKKLILPEGYSMNIKSEGINSIFDVTNKLITKINNLRVKNIDFGDVNIGKPILKIYPGKVTYEKTTTIRFQNNLQLKNIKNNLLNNSKQGNFDLKVSSTNIKNLLGVNNQKIKFPTDKEIENEFKKTIPGFNLDTAKKVYRRTEVVEYSLLVPNIEQVKNKMQLLDIKSISKAEILQNFENLKSIQKNFPQKPKSDNFNGTDVKVGGVLIKSNYCSLIYGSGTSEEKTNCINLQNNVLHPKSLYNIGTLLNGFSIGTENRKGIHDSLSIDLGFWEKKIFEYGIYLHYNYGIGLRIPLKYKEILSKGDIYDYNNYRDYTGSIEITPFNADKNFYVNKIGAKKSFDGKEFYLGFGASVEWNFWVIKVGSTNGTIPLIKILGYAIRNLNNDARDSSTLMGKLTDTMVNDNYLGFKKDFVPPLGIGNCSNSTNPTLNSLFGNFGNDNVITNSHCTNIVNAKGIKIPLAEIPLGPTPITFTTKLNLGLDVNLHNSKITAKCEDINSEGFCSNEIINFNPNNNKVKYSSSGIGKVINTDYAGKNDFGSYVGYGPKFSNIKYNTDIQYVFQVGLGGYLEHIPVLGSIGVDTPYYDLYSLDVNTDLETHTGTNGIIDITNKSKLYLEYETKIKEINSVEIGGDKYYLHYNNIGNGSSIFDGEDGKSLTVDGSKTWFYLPKQRQNMGHIIDNKYTTNSFNFLNDIKTYYTLDGTEPLCKGLNGYEYKRVDNLGHLNKKQNILWKTYYRDYKNHKGVTLKVISCDNVSNQKTKVFTKNNITLINTYHIPFAIYNGKKINNIPELQIGLNKTNLFRFKLAINNLQLGVGINSTINGNVIDYIKYAYLDKDVNPNNLKCNNNIGKIYSGEELTNADAFIDSNGILSSGGEKKLVIVKCSNDNYNYTSIPKVYALKAKRINNFKNPIDGNKFKNLQFDKNVKGNLGLLGEKNLGNNGNIFNGNLLNGGKLNGGVVPNGAQTFGYNPENQNPWGNATKGYQQGIGVQKNVGLYGNKFNYGRNTGKGVQSGIHTMNNTGTPPAPNSGSITRKYADTKYQGCDHNDLVIGNKVWSSCDVKYPLSDLTNTVGKITNNPNLPDKNYLGYQYGSYFDEESAVCNIGYHVPNKEEFNSLISEFSNSSNTRRDKLAANKIIEYMMFPLAGDRSGETGKYIGVYKYSSYIGSHVNDLGRHGYAGGFNEFVVSNNEGLFSETNVYVKYPNYEEEGGNYSLRCVRNTLATKNEKLGNQQQVYIKVDEGDYAAGFGKKYGSGYVQKNNGDGITRNYAKTKFPRCEEKDIILGNQVWAACNETKTVLASYFKGNVSLKDENGWNYGLYYNKEGVKNVCGNGYRLPTIAELSSLENKDNILRISRGGYYYGNKLKYLNLMKYIISSENKFMNLDGQYRGEGSIISFYQYFPVRCIRNTLATDEELGINSGSSQGSDGNGDANSQNNSLTSTDEYVNEKLDEINGCFINTYNGHLTNINNTIKQFNVTKDMINDQKIKDKYAIAIKKLEEIKRRFLMRYKFIINYENLN